MLESAIEEMEQNNSHIFGKFGSVNDNILNNS